MQNARLAGVFLFQGELDENFQAAFSPVFSVDFSALGFHQLAGNCQAEACSARSALAGLFSAPETQEDFGQIFGRNAGAIVADG